MKSVFTIYLCIFSFFLLVSISSARITIKEEISFYWNKLWTTSCHFSPPLSRTRRSVDLPNVDDPKELFDYLLPLANVKPEDFSSSQSGSRSFSDYASSWVEDVVDLWHQECRRRRHQDKHKQSGSILQRKKRTVKKSVRKRSTVRNQGVRQDDVITWENYPQNLTYVYAYSPMTTTASPSSFSKPASTEDEDKDEEEQTEEEEEKEEVDVDVTDDDDEEVGKEKYEKDKEMTTAKTEVEENTKGSDGEEDEETTTEAASTTTAATASRLSAIPADTGTEYFSSYGGDVEYFYPIIAFGIPFDGYITVLGFHGFTGIFTW